MPLYLNTDLELKSNDDLSTFTEALGERGYPLHEENEDGFFSTFELSTDYENPALAIAAWCDVIESLSEDVKTLWRGCTARTLDIGLESDTESNAIAASFEPELLGRLVALEVTLAYTLYPMPDPTEVSASPVEPH